MLGGRVPVTFKLGSGTVPRSNSGLEEMPTNDIPAGAKSFGDSKLRDPATIKGSDLRLGKINSLGHKHYSGPVYNLETTDSIYIANGVVGHNCMCVVVLVDL